MAVGGTSGEFIRLTLHRSRWRIRLADLGLSINLYSEALTSPRKGLVSGPVLYGLGTGYRPRRIAFRGLVSAGESWAVRRFKQGTHYIL
jgi:hypothetical protein